MPKVKVYKKVEQDIKTLYVDAGVRYWEDATVNSVEDEAGDLIPCREGDRWRPVIDVEKGQIINWKQGVKAEIHYKVCDDGIYELQDENGKAVLKHDGYVPEMMCPEPDGFGDYIIMNVDENGIIDKWEFDVAGFQNGSEGID